MILIAMTRFKPWLHVLNLCECRIYINLTSIVKHEEWRCPISVIEKFEELKFHGKYFMAMQNFFKSCECVKSTKINLLFFENLEIFEQFESKLESNWHWPRMRKNYSFLIKNEFQRPRFGGSFWSQKACPFCRDVRILIYGTRFRAGYSSLTAGFAGITVKYEFCLK